MKKNLRFTKTDSTKSDTEFGKNKKIYLVAESEEENSEFYKTLANFGEVGQIIGANRKETQDLENLIKSYEQEEKKDKEITADQKEKMDKTISDAKNATMELNQKLNKELIPRYKFLGDGIEAEYSNLTANLNATQTLADQNGQYAIGNQTLLQDAQQNYTDLHKKYQMTNEQLIKFESLFNQTKEDLNQCKINLNTTQTLADQCNENLNSENKEISDLKSYLAGNQSDYNNELSSLGKKLKKEQGYAKTEEHIIHRYRTEYNITGPLSNHNSEKNKHLIEGAVIGAGGTSLLFVIGALLNYKFSNKKPLFQQTIDELVDTEVLALIKFMDDKMKDQNVENETKKSIIKIFDSEFKLQSENQQPFNQQGDDDTAIANKWKELSTYNLYVTKYGPESETRYSTAYKKLSEIGKSLNDFNEKGDKKVGNGINYTQFIEKGEEIAAIENAGTTFSPPNQKAKPICYTSLINQFKNEIKK